MRPIFFIIGAQRSGSTSLAGLFETNGAFVLGTEPPESRLLLHTKDPGGYLRQMADRVLAPSSDAVIVEKSTTYMERPEAARAASRVQDAEAIAILRDPVWRAVSNYWFTRSQGIERLPIEAAFQSDSLNRQWDSARFSTSPFAYLQRSGYSALLRPWLDALGERLHILILEELAESPESPSSIALCELGVDPQHLSMPKKNASSSGTYAGEELLSLLSIQLRSEIYWVEQLLQRRLPVWRTFAAQGA